MPVASLGSAASDSGCAGPGGLLKVPYEGTFPLATFPPTSSRRAHRVAGKREPLSGAAPGVRGKRPDQAGCQEQHEQLLVGEAVPNAQEREYTETHAFHHTAKAHKHPCPEPKGDDVQKPCRQEPKKAHHGDTAMVEEPRNQENHEDVRRAVIAFIEVLEIVGSVGMRRATPLNTAVTVPAAM